MFIDGWDYPLASGSALGWQLWWGKASVLQHDPCSCLAGTGIHHDFQR